MQCGHTYLPHFMCPDPEAEAMGARHPSWMAVSSLCFFMRTAGKEVLVLLSFSLGAEQISLITPSDI